MPDSEFKDTLDMLQLGDDVAKFEMRLPRDLHDKLKARAAAVSQPNAVYIRGILYRELMADPDTKFLDHFMEWWVWKGQGDRQQIVGAIARARGGGMSFAFKFRMVVKQFLDHGLL